MNITVNEFVEMLEVGNLVTSETTDAITYYSDFPLTIKTYLTASDQISFVLDEENNEYHSIVVVRNTDENGSVRYFWTNPDYLNDERDQWLTDKWDLKPNVDHLYNNWDMQFEDIVNKALALVNGTPFDDRIVMALDLDEDTQKFIEEQAAAQGISIDELVEQIIEAEIKRLAEENNSESKNSQVQV